MILLLMFSSCLCRKTSAPHRLICCLRATVGMQMTYLPMTSIDVKDPDQSTKSTTPYSSKLDMQCDGYCSLCVTRFYSDCSTYNPCGRHGYCRLLEDEIVCDCRFWWGGPLCTECKATESFVFLWRSI